MIFQKESIEAILAGRKTMTRRLVKEGEGFSGDEKGILKVFKINSNKNKSILKWQVGRKYAVCPGRGKPQVWYCPKCKKIVNQNENNWNYSKRRDLFKPMPFNYCGGEVSFKFPSGKCKYNPCGGKLERLFVEVTGIQKEKLLDISEEDAKREGFLTKAHFIETFYKINKIKYQTLVDEKLSKFLNQPESFIAKKNPGVWVISFSKVIE